MLILDVFFERQQLMPQPNKYPAVQKKSRADRSVIFLSIFEKIEKNHLGPPLCFFQKFSKKTKGGTKVIFFSNPVPDPENPAIAHPEKSRPGQ